MWFSAEIFVVRDVWFATEIAVGRGIPKFVEPRVEVAPHLLERERVRVQFQLLGGWVILTDGKNRGFELGMIGVGYFDGRNATTGSSSSAGTTGTPVSV